MEKKWWMDKIAYQIYPKSFYDSNGDGIGDIAGIIEKIDDLKNLGVDILWLSPVYASPMADQGYDISDYYDIDPRFGTLEDMDRLIAEAKKRDMYIVMDLVVNHCSDEHAWFQAALKDPEGKYGKYFYIEEKKDGKLPCNLRSYFGGSVWEPIPGTDKYYFHAFHKKQPDLNWENEELREEIYKMMNWWFKHGISGFRIDAIINIKKKLPFHDYAPDREDGLAGMGEMLKEAEGIGAFLTEMREKTFARHDAFTVGEVFNDKKEEIEAFIGKDGYFCSKFDFAPEGCGKSEKGWYENRAVSPEEYKNACFTSQLTTGDIGFLSNIIENHDEPRGVSRYIPKEDLSETSKKALATAYFFLRGIPFLYQGQEIGMENMEFRSIDQIDDVSTREEYQVMLAAGLSRQEALRLVDQYSRDNARTPFQWSDEKNAGFSSGNPWLVVNPKYKRINLLEQKGRMDSLYHYYKAMIALRKNKEFQETLTYGEFEPYLREQENLFAYFRKSEKQTLLILVNFKNEAQTVELPCEPQKILLNSGAAFCMQQKKCLLNPYQALVILL